MLDGLKFFNNLAFLNTLVKRDEEKLSTTVYVKSTNTGYCLNYNSICPERYKLGVIKTLIHRAYYVSSDWINFTIKIDRLKQLLVNNNFPMSLIDKTVNEFINLKYDYLPQENNSSNTNV